MHGSSSICTARREGSLESSSRTELPCWICQYQEAENAHVTKDNWPRVTVLRQFLTTELLQSLTIKRLQLEELGRTEMVIGHVHSSGDLENALKRFRYFWQVLRAAPGPLPFMSAAWNCTQQHVGDIMLCSLGPYWCSQRGGFHWCSFLPLSWSLPQEEGMIWRSPSFSPSDFMTQSHKV